MRDDTLIRNNNVSLTSEEKNLLGYYMYDIDYSEQTNKYTLDERDNTVNQSLKMKLATPFGKEYIYYSMMMNIDSWTSWIDVWLINKSADKSFPELYSNKSFPELYSKLAYQY